MESFWKIENDYEYWAFFYIMVVEAAYLGVLKAMKRKKTDSQFLLIWFYASLTAKESFQQTVLQSFLKVPYQYIERYPASKNMICTS